MKLHLLLAAVAMGLALAGCNNDGGAGPDVATGRSIFGNRDSAAPAGMDELYTIQLHSESGPNHASAMAAFKANAETNTHWKDLFVIHEEGHSTLCWGRYPSVADAQLQKNLRTAKAYRAPATGAAVFIGAFAVPLPGEDFGPREWNICNASGAYTVLVAVFYDMPEKNYVGRKKFAVDLVRELRSRGQEAYFYHGPVRSHVCVGLFAADSVQYVRQGALTVPQVRDGRINKIMADFPQLAVNGAGVRNVTAVDERTKRPVVEDQKSFIVEVPKSGKLGSLATPAASPGTERPVSDRPPAGIGNTQLR
jgi:predicted small secreted protein